MVRKKTRKTRRTRRLRKQRGGSISHHKNYHIICARYNKSVDFLKEIKIPHTVIEKGDGPGQVPNKAHEASSYLKYIIDKYDTLPENMIFIHDGNTSWHHIGKITEKINEWIDIYEKMNKGYYEFNATTINKSNPKDYMAGYTDFWDSCMKSEFGEYKDAFPEEGKCCAQFIVSKKVIHRHQKSFYQTMYDWLINKTVGEGNGDYNNLYSGFCTSRYLEWSWRFIFLSPIQRGGATKSAMVILEPRNHPKLKVVLENVHKHMPISWDLYVFHGPNAAKAAKDAVINIETSERKVFLKSIGVDNMRADDYNRKFQERAFWDQVDAENILVFQTDSMLCDARPIDEFLKYDYIACSTGDKYGDNSLWSGKNPFYGHGGLSFRHKSFMMKCIDKHGGKGIPEDVLFSKCVHEDSPPSARPESSEVLHRFCTQRDLTEKSFGVHKLTEFGGDKTPVFEFCPDAKLL